MSDSRVTSTLSAKAQETHFQFLRVDLTLCQAFADNVLRELTKHSRQMAKESFARAERGYAEINRLVVRLDDGAQRSEIEQGLSALRLQLDELQNEFPSFKASTGGTGD